MQWEKYWIPPAVTAADRARQYGKARAARGWEPWQRWEDRMVENLVEHGRRSVTELAKRLQRTENAILCRIEKRYGKVTRDEHNHCYVVHPKPQHHYLERTMSYEPSDAKIYFDAVSDIRKMLHYAPPGGRPERIAYRVTPAEYGAIGRHIAHNGWRLVGMTILGVEIVQTLPEPEPIIKDYGISG